MAKTFTSWAVAPASLLRLFVVLVCAGTFVSAYNQYDHDEIASRGWDDHDDYGARDYDDSYYAVRGWEDITPDDYTLRSLEQSFSMGDFSTRELAEELRARLAEFDALDTRQNGKGKDNGKGKGKAAPRASTASAGPSARLSTNMQVYIAYYARGVSGPDPYKTAAFHTGVLVTPDLDPTKQVVKTALNSKRYHLINSDPTNPKGYTLEITDCTARSPDLVGVLRVGELAPANVAAFNRIADGIRAPSPPVSRSPSPDAGSKGKGPAKKGSASSLKSGSPGPDTRWTCHSFTKAFLTALGAQGVVRLEGNAEAMWRAGYNAFDSSKPMRKGEIFYLEPLPTVNSGGTTIPSRIGPMNAPPNGRSPSPEPVNPVVSPARICCVIQ